MAFTVSTEVRDGIALITLEGELDAVAAGEFRNAVEQVAEEDPRRLVLLLDELTFMASAGSARAWSSPNRKWVRT